MIGYTECHFDVFVRDVWTSLEQWSLLVHSASTTMVGILCFIILCTKCSASGAAPTYLPLQNDGTHATGDIIAGYFNLGFTYAEILGLLVVYHDTTISFRTLHRILRSLRLRRHSRIRDWNIVVGAVENELAGSGCNLGYRGMASRLRLVHGLSVPREYVRLILAQLDSDGVRMRQQRRLRRRQYSAKGPCYIYHIDGWDKLKKYGLCIHGCIDGFSRRIMWLEAAASNNNPYSVCKYFADCVRQQNGIPSFVRADRGTENCNVELMQRILRAENDDEIGRNGITFLYGSSPSNQRIEAWWSKFRSLAMQAWMDHFAQLEGIGIIDTSRDVDRQCIRYVYLDLLRQELQGVMTMWNTHAIRSYRRCLPSGKPDVMFYLPQIYDTRSYKKPVDIEVVEELSDILTMDLPDCNNIYREIFQSICEEYHLGRATTLDEGSTLLVRLLDTFDNELQQL